MSQQSDLMDFLQRSGLVSSSEPGFVPLTGGVSSDVWLVTDGGRRFVVKRSVPKLRVKAEWFSDPARLRYEFLYLQTVAGIVPDAVPALFTKEPDSRFLAMEFLGDGFENWKSRLLGGIVEPEQAACAGKILGTVHAATAHDPAVKARFDTMEFFTQLRIDAYLRATAEKQAPPVAEKIRAEADRLASHHESLVHGDFSPKNMMVGEKRFVVLDCETACFGDPAFDLGFVLNHLLLKALYHSQRSASTVAALAGAADSLHAAYSAANSSAAESVEVRTARLLPMLLLARVDGKSPVEYLEAPQQEHVRKFSRHWIPTGNQDLGTVIQNYFDTLPQHHS